MPENVNAYIKVGIYIYYKTYGNNYGAYLYEPTAFPMPPQPSVFLNPTPDINTKISYVG